MKQRYTILIHIGLWILIYIPTILAFAFSDKQAPPDRYWVIIISLIFTLINFYLFYSYLIPVFYTKKKRLYLLLLTIFFVLLFPIIRINIFSFLVSIFHWHSRRIKHLVWFYTETYTITILYTGLAYLARFTTKWILDQQIKTELINQNQASELALLRSQINPHFLFNTLNNIYSLVYKKSNQAPTAMMKLSDIMRYMLYEANTDKVLLTKEIEYLESYIELLDLRVNKKNFIEFTISGKCDDNLIAPMLLIPFVENAFKHCNKKSSSPGVKIDVHVRKNLLTFQVHNSTRFNQDENEEGSGGIGLKNVQRRLELLYHGKYNLIINKEPDFYKVKLTIEL